MLEGLTYQKKFYALLGLIGLFLILSYQLSLSKTFAQFANLRQEKERLARANDAPAKIGQLQQQLAMMDAQVGKLDRSFEQFQAQLLSNVVELGEQFKVQIISVDKPHSYERNGFEVQTAVIRLRGNFAHLTKVVNGLELKQGEGRIAATHFEVIEDKKTKKYALEAQLYIQNFKKL